VYHDSVFLKRSHLLNLELTIKSCASVIGRGSVASQNKGKDLNQPLKIDRSLICNVNLREYEIFC